MHVGGGFNPRPRAGGDITLHYVEPVHVGGVSIHAPARGATRANTVPGRSIVFQSTPPRGGRLDLVLDVADRVLVSIHAPARGAN